MLLLRKMVGVIIKKSLTVLLDAGLFPDSIRSSISKHLNSLDQEVATFTRFRDSIFDAVSHRSSMNSLQTSIHSRASKYATISADLAAQERLIEELKAKFTEAKETCGNMWHSIQLMKQYLSQLFVASSNPSSYQRKLHNRCGINSFHCS